MEKFEQVIKDGLADIQKQVEIKSNETVASFEAKLSAIQKQIDEKGEAFSKEAGEAIAKQLDAIEVSLKNRRQDGGEEKSFNQNLAETIKENADRLKAFASSKGGELKIEMKAVGDMSFAANFAGGLREQLTTEVRPLTIRPDRKVHMRDIIPSGSTNATTIYFPVDNGGEGAPAVWTAGEKPKMDFDFTGKSVTVKWIAGIVRIPREMLDDIPFLTSYLQNKMLKALYKAEDAEILNGPNLDAIIPQAQAYNGNKTTLVEQLIDAGYGQIDENGYAVSHAIINSREWVDVMLNKAAGSGEYDQPGNLQDSLLRSELMSAMNVVRVDAGMMQKGAFLVGDFSEAQLITKMAPEIKFFEQDGNNATTNMITVRIEERIALAVTAPKAFVKKATV